MSDPFDALRHIPQAPSPALPAAEVRRRGDRLRRRRTIGTSLAAACAVIAVTAGAVAATGQLQGPQSSPPPATQAPEPTPTPTAVITAIPEDFPIEAGMQSPDGVDSVPAKDVSVVANLVLCGPASYSPADTATDHLGIRTLGERSVEGRDVDLYADKGAASSAVADLVGKYQACPKFDDPDGRVALTEVSPVEALGDEAWLVSRTYEKDGAPVAGQEIVHVVRRGSAVVVAQLASDGPGATDEAALAATVEEQQDALQVLLDALAG